MPDTINNSYYPPGVTSNDFNYSEGLVPCANPTCENHGFPEAINDKEFERNDRIFGDFVKYKTTHGQQVYVCAECDESFWDDPEFLADLVEK